MDAAEVNAEFGRCEYSYQCSLKVMNFYSNPLRNKFIKRVYNTCTLASSGNPLSGILHIFNLHILQKTEVCLYSTTKDEALFTLTE